MAAGIDLCLHVVARDHGAAAANAIARRMVVAPHRGGGQAQFVERALPAATGDGLGGHARVDARAPRRSRSRSPRWPATPSAASARSPATSAPRPARTPLRWLHEQRILHARRLLEETDLPVEDVAARCGFGTATTLREHFGRSVHTTPTAYRRAFSAAAR